MNISISVRDGISADLAKKIKAMENRKPVLQKMGQALVGMAKKSWDEPALRPITWLKRKKDTGKKLLYASGHLSKSPRIVKVTNDSATVGSHIPYAAVHQFGSSKKKGRGSGIPPRPFWPLTGSPESPQLTPKAAEAVEAAARRALDPTMR